VIKLIAFKINAWRIKGMVRPILNNSMIF